MGFHCIKFNCKKLTILIPRQNLLDASFVTAGKIFPLCCLVPSDFYFVYIRLVNKNYEVPIGT